jgi:hypothetical protein
VGRFRVHVRRELVFLALGTMEACVVTPFLAAILALIAPVQPLLVMGVFLGAVLAVHYVARLSLRLSLHPTLRSGLLGLGMLLSGLVVVHQFLHAQVSLWNPAWLSSVFCGLQRGKLSLDVIVFLLVLFLWWRGLVLAQRRLESDTLVSRFRSGLVIFAVTTVVSGTILPAPPYQFVFVYFFVSLVGIALARAEEVGRQYGGGQSPFGLGWMTILVSASLVILLLAAGLATLLTGENVSRFVGPIWEIQRTILTLLAYILMFVLYWVVNAVVGLLESIFSDLDLSGFQQVLGVPEDLGMSEQTGQALFTPEQLALARSVGIIVLLVLIVVVLSLRRLRMRAARHQDEDRESVWEEVNLRSALRDLLLDGRRRLRETADALGHSYLERVFAVLTIRRIYAHTSALAEKLGYPRALHETPYEYLSTLERAFPDHCEEAARITKAYVAAHYGEVPDRPEDLEAIRAAWEQIREVVAVVDR